MFPHLMDSAKVVMGTAGPWSQLHLALLLGLPCEARIREAQEVGGKERQREGPGEAAEPGNHPFLRAHSGLF